MQRNIAIYWYKTMAVDETKFTGTNHAKCTPAFVSSLKSVFQWTVPYVNHPKNRLY